MRTEERKKIAALFKIVENKLRSALPQYKDFKSTTTNTELWLSLPAYKDINFVFRINTRLMLWSIRFTTFTDFVRAKVYEQQDMLKKQLGDGVVFTESWKGIYEEHKLTGLDSFDIDFVVARLTAYVTVFTNVCATLFSQKSV